RADFEPIARLLFAIPGLLVLAEFYRYYTNVDRRELPFNVVALLQYYVAFAFPSLVEITFFDLNGPVSFTSATRFSGSIAVAGGALLLYAGMRIGEPLGLRLRRPVVAACPPAELPSGFQTAAWIYLGLCVLSTMTQIAAPAL